MPGMIKAANHIAIVRLIQRHISRATKLVYALAFANLGAEPTNWIVFLIDDALLHRNDRVICDANVLGTYFSAALCNVAHT